jgi:hypothetical protein
MATVCGKLNVLVVQPFSQGFAINKNPDRFSDRGFKSSALSSNLPEGLHFVSAMMTI